jgi:ketosteroid isomerase-like protein
MRSRECLHGSHSRGPRMRTRSRIAILLFAMTAACGVVPLPLGPTDASTPPPLRAQNAQFQTLATRWFGIWGDDPVAIAEAEALFAPDADALHFDGFVPVEGLFGEAGWRAAARRATTQRFELFELSPREGVWLRRHGDRAVATVQFGVKMRAGGKSGETQGFASLICEQRGGEWRIVHEHTSIVLLEEWLGGVDADLEAVPFDHIQAGDSEFQILIDTYLAEVDATRTADLLHADVPSRYFDEDIEPLVFEPTSRRPLLGWTGVGAYRDAPDLRIYLTNKKSRGDVRVWKSGDWAWTTFTFTARATRRNGDRFQVVGRQTEVFQRIDGGWLIVHEHASVPYAPEGTPGVRAEIVLARAVPTTTRSIPRLPMVVPASSLVDSTPDRQEFQRRIADYCAAWSTVDGELDWARTQRLYAGGDGPVFFEAARTGVPALRSLEERKKALYEGRSVSVTPRNDLHVTRNGNVAWTTISLDVVTQTDDGPESRRVQYQTSIWERRGARWVIVNEHLSAAE